MDKYREAFNDRVKPKMDHDSGVYGVNPFRDSQKALRNAEFASKEREQFFSDCYGEILSDLFVTWLKTEPHAIKEREFLYSAAMSLGEVKRKMLNFETLGKNTKFINNPKAQEGAKETNE